MGAVSLKTHQEQHALRLLELLRSKSGGGVALDVSPTGTGKTYTAAWVVAQLPDHHVVVVCPTIVRRTWENLVPEAKIITYGMLTLGATKTGVVVPDLPPRVLDLRGDLEAHLSRPRTLLIVDEVHRARHVASQTSRALCSMCACVQAAEGGKILCLSATFMDGMCQIRLLPRLYPRSFAAFESSAHDHHEMMGCRGREREAKAVLCRVLGVPEGSTGDDWLRYARMDPYFSRIAEKYEGRKASAECFLRSASKPFCPLCVLSFLESTRTAMDPNPEAEEKHVEDVYLEGSSTLSESMRLRAFYAYMDASPSPLSRADKRPRPDLSQVPAPLTGPPATHLSCGSAGEHARVDLHPDFNFVQRTDWTLSSDEAYEAWRLAHRRYEILGRADLAWSASVPLLMLSLAREPSSSSNGVGLRVLQEVESRKACGLASHVYSRLQRGGGWVEASGNAEKKKKKKVVIMFNFLEPMRACGRELERLLALDHVRERGLVAQICGDTPARTRQEIVEAFRDNSGGPMCLLCTMGTMKEGVSLHDERGVCPRELYIMPNFSSISLIQASGRVHRENAASASMIFRVYGQRDSGGSVEKSLEHRLESRRRTMILLGTSASETAVLVGKHAQGGKVMDADLRAWLIEEYARRMEVPRREHNDLVLGKYRWLASRMRPCFSPVGTSRLWDPLEEAETHTHTHTHTLHVSVSLQENKLRSVEGYDSCWLDERPTVSNEHDAVLRDITPVA